MRKLAIAALMAAPLTALGAQVDEKDIHKVCSTYGKLAEVTMELRQEGVPLRKQMDTIDPRDGILSAITQLAYDVQVARTAKAKEHAVSEYGNLWYRKCTDGAKKQVREAQ